MILHGLMLLSLTATVAAAEPNPAQQLVGTWVSITGQGGDTTTASLTFDKDGRMNNRIVSRNGIRMRIGFYKLEMNQLTVTLEEDRKTQTNTVLIKQLTQDTLTIEDDSGTSVFKRKM